MVLDLPRVFEKGQARRQLLNQYMRLQNDLVDGDAADSSYQSTVHAFRKLGSALMSAGYEEDLDRLLRLRVIEGGRETGAPRTAGPPRLLRVVDEQGSA